MSQLSVSNISKSFDGICALSDVSFDVVKGECLALVGENGAGKSTLMKILSGVWPIGSYQGNITFEGSLLSVRDPLEARRRGISIIHQELCLFAELSVAENLFLTDAYPYDGIPSISLWACVHWKDIFEKASMLFKELGFSLNPRELVRNLSVAEKQLVEIAKAFHHRSRLLILDEPTSALTQKETEQLFSVIEKMKTKVTFIYISHKLDEVFRIADRILILRDGKAVKSMPKAETTSDEVIFHMVGRSLKKEPRLVVCPSEKVVLTVENYEHRSRLGKSVLKNISFFVREGEILGVSGLMGSGRSELLRSLLGVLPGHRSGKVWFEGQSVLWRGIDSAMRSGVAFLPEDRKKDGLFLNHAVDFNLTLSILSQLKKTLGWLDLRKENSTAKQLGSEMRVKCSEYSAPVKTLSGGNQQKVLLAKIMARRPRLLFLDEPTRGIDVGAKEEIYELIRNFAKHGLAIILVSSELAEILALSHRVAIMRDGFMVATAVNENLTQEQVMSFATGAD